ncbi:hypothetical protein H6G91_34430 [Nostoc muscorum FACHB-395]|nr:hypothetical protein [Desmonostoc muscorum FACHB-395]
MKSNRGTGITREGEGYTAGNGFALNKKLPAGRRVAKRLKSYTSPDTLYLLFWYHSSATGFESQIYGYAKSF